MIGIDVQLYISGGHRREIDDWLREEGLIDAKIVQLAPIDEAGRRVRAWSLDLDGYQPGMDEIPVVEREHVARTPLAPAWLGTVPDVVRRPVESVR